MKVVLTHLRAHHWQRRILTLSLALIVGAVAAMILFPLGRAQWLVWRLSGPDPAVRAQAMTWGVPLAAQSPLTVRRLNAALDGADDRTFFAIVVLLRQVKAFDTPQRPPAQLDRLRAIDMKATHSAEHPESATQGRRLLLQQTILAGRDNPYVRDILRQAATDESPKVRAAAGVLAARLKDLPAMARLLTDADASVAGEAAIDAALGGLSEMAQPIAAAMKVSADADVQAACAYALARLAPRQYSPEICGLLQSAKNESLRDWLPDVAALLDDEAARQVVRNILEDARRAHLLAPAEALLAAAKLKMASAGPWAKETLSAAASGDARLKESQLLAALELADRLNLPVRREVNDLCRALWEPRYTMTLVAAARLLGKQAILPQDDPNAPTAEECMQTLRLGAVFSRIDQPATQSATQAASEPAVVTTPLPSAAAATALWLLQPSVTYMRRQSASDEANGLLELRIDRDASAFYIHVAASQDSSLPADYISWHLSRSGAKEAFELGLSLLPPPVNPNVPRDRQPLRVYNANARAAGVMLLALAWRTSEQKQQAVERLRFRLGGGYLGNMPSLLDRAMYECGLLALGRNEFRPEVEMLLLADFPPRRAITALCAAGDRAVLDWMLGDTQTSDDEVIYLLINTWSAEVLAAAVPELPRLDFAQNDAMRRRQVRILRDYYAIHREGIQFSSVR